jgi:hypothetical protein
MTARTRTAPPRDRTIPESKAADPPSPPELPREIRFYWYQWVGAAVILLIVGLAVFGVFGERVAKTRAADGALELRIEYPSRFRYQQVNAIQVWVTNQGGRPLDTVTVSFSGPYLLQFSNLTILPSPERPFDVPVTDLEPGATRLVRAEIQAERYGKHAGWIAATAANGDTVRAALSTIVYP